MHRPKASVHQLSTGGVPTGASGGLPRDCQRCCRPAGETSGGRCGPSTSHPPAGSVQRDDVSPELLRVRRPTLVCCTSQAQPQTATPTVDPTASPTGALDTPRWQPLLDHLAAHPGGTLATIMSTPWRLCLTATVYHHDGDPAELLALPDADSLDQHLLARYTPTPPPTLAATRPRTSTAGSITSPPSLSHRRSPNHGPPGSGGHLVLHELWPLAGRTRVRATDALLTTLTVLPLSWTALPQVLPGPTAVFISALAAASGAGGVSNRRRIR